VREEAAAASARPTPRGGDAQGGELGLTLGPVTAQTRRIVGLDAATTGAVVTRVAPDGLAAAAGLRPGDVVLGVGASSIASPAEAMRAIRDAWQRTGSAVALRIFRDGLPGYVAVGGGGTAK
jgi:serine protease Do